MAPGGAFFVIALFMVFHRESSKANFINPEENDALMHYHQNKREIFGILRSIAEFLSLLLLAQGIEPNPGPLALGTESTNEVDLRNKKRLPGIIPVNKGEITSLDEEVQITTTCVDSALSAPRYSPERGDDVSNGENTDSDWDDDTSCSSIQNKKVGDDFINQFSRSETRTGPSMSDDFCSNSDTDSDIHSVNNKGACSDAFMNAVQLLKCADREHTQSRNGSLRGVSMDDDFCEYSSTDSDSCDNKEAKTNDINTGVVEPLKYNEENTNKVIRPVSPDDKLSSQCGKDINDDSDWDSDTDSSASGHADQINQNGKTECNVPKVTYYDVKDYADTDDDMDSYSDLEYDDDNDKSHDEKKHTLISNIVPEKANIEQCNGEVTTDIQSFSKDNGSVEVACEHNDAKTSCESVNAMKSRSPSGVEIKDESDWDSDSETTAICSSNIKVETVMPYDEKENECSIRSVPKGSSKLQKEDSDTDAELSDWDEDSIKSCDSLPLDKPEETVDQKAVLQDSDSHEAIDNVKVIEPETVNIQSKEHAMVQNTRTDDEQERAQKKVTFAPNDTVNMFNPNGHSSGDTTDSSSISWSDTSDDYAHMSNTDSIEKVPNLPLDECVGANTSDDVALIPSLPLDETSKDPPTTKGVAQSCETPHSITESEGLVTCEEIFDWSAYMNKDYSKLPKEVEQAEQKKLLLECVSSKSDTSTDSVKACISKEDNTLDDVSDIKSDASLYIPLDIDVAQNNSRNIKQVDEVDETPTEDALVPCQPLKDCMSEKSDISSCTGVSQTDEYIHKASVNLESYENVIDEGKLETSTVASNTSLDTDSFSLQAAPIRVQEVENLAPPSIPSNRLSTTFQDMSEVSSCCDLTVHDSVCKGTSSSDGHSANNVDAGQVDPECIGHESCIEAINANESQNLDTNIDEKPVDHLDIEVEILEPSKLEQIITNTSIIDKKVFNTVTQVDKVIDIVTCNKEVQVIADKIEEKGIQVELNECSGVQVIDRYENQKDKGIEVRSNLANEEKTSEMKIVNEICNNINNTWDKAIQVEDIIQEVSGSKIIQVDITHSKKSKSDMKTHNIGIQVENECSKKVTNEINSKNDINRGANSVINIENLVIHMNQMADETTVGKATTDSKQPCNNPAGESDIETNKSNVNVTPAFDVTKCPSMHNSVKHNRKRKWLTEKQQKKKETNKDDADIKTREHVQPVVNTNSITMTPSIERNDFLGSIAEPPNDDRRMSRKRKFQKLKENADKKLVKSTKSAPINRNELITSQNEMKPGIKKTVRFAEPEYDDSVLSTFYLDEPVSLSLDKGGGEETLNRSSNTTEDFLNKIVKLIRTEIEENIENKLRRCVQIRNTNAGYVGNNMKPRIHDPYEDIKPEYLSMIDNKKCNGENVRNGNIGNKNDTVNVVRRVTEKKKDKTSRFSRFLHRIFK
ncbi:hypothetical protein ACF0H5_014020 [Mactra antiquata]